ncbi:unnamed protein product [Closterium sp. NIES-53]
MVAARASTPQDFLSCRLASSHLRRISLLPEILAVLPSPALACPAKHYTLACRSFLSACAAAGNAEAAFLLGMVEFYCLERVASGMKRLVQAAKAGHAAALHSLSIIHFNGSGLPTSGVEGSGAAEGGGAAEGNAGRRKLRGNRKVGMGMLLCVAAAKAGHPDALRELGLCLQDGFGIKRSVAQGRLLLVEANLRELANSGDSLADFRRAGGMCAVTRVVEEWSCEKESFAAVHRVRRLATARAPVKWWTGGSGMRSPASRAAETRPIY